MKCLMNQGTAQRSGGRGGGSALNEVGLRPKVQPLTLLYTIFDR